MPKAKTNNALQKSTAQGRAFFASKKPSGPRMAFVCLCLTCHLCTAHRGGRLLNPQPALGRRCVAAGLVFANIRAFGSPSAKSVSLPFSRRFYLILCVVFAEMVFNLFSLGGTMFGTLRLANPSYASFPFHGFIIPVNYGMRLAKIQNILPQCEKKAGRNDPLALFYADLSPYTGL